MNCGLTNLDTLKRHLLAESLGSSTQFDAVIAGIGLAMAGLFDRYCNRSLAYLAGAEVVLSADRDHLVLPRYPVVSVTSVETKYLGESAWTAVDNEPELINEKSGIVQFGCELGTAQSLVRVVYTGGYWFETLEPEDDGYPTAMPEGAPALPGDLKGAFLLQCEQVWAKRDKLGTGILDKPAEGTGLQGLELVPLVKELLRGHIRYQLS